MKFLSTEKIILLFAAKVTVAFSSLIQPERIKVLILDDSVIFRNRSKAVELQVRVYAHVTHKYKKSEYLHLLSTDCSLVLKLWTFTRTVGRPSAFLSIEIFINAWNRVPKQKL